MKLGLFWSLCSALLWSTTFISARYLLSNGEADPIGLSAARFALGAMLLLGFGLTARRRELLAVRPRDLLSASALGLFGVVGMSVLLFYGQVQTTAANAAIILQLSPVFTVALAWLLGDERPRLMSGAGMLVALAGTLLVAGIVTAEGIQLRSSGALGSLMVLGAAFCWAIYSVFGKRLVLRLGGYAATTWCMVMGAVVLTAWQLFNPAPSIWPHSTKGWCVIAYLGIFPTAVAFYAWYEAMRRIDMVLLNVMQYLSPPFTILLAWWLLKEVPGWTTWIGIFLIAAGVVLVGLKSKAAK